MHAGGIAEQGHMRIRSGAKACKVRNFQALIASKKANEARLKSAFEFGKSEMGEGSELHESVLRAVIHAVMVTHQSGRRR